MKERQATLFDGSGSGAVLPTPREMVERLDRTVIGQEEAKRALSSAVYAHYLGGAWASESGSGDLGPQHVLLLGPTGSGKTHMVRSLASMLGVPVCFGSATALAEVGYKGDSVDTLVRNLVEAAGGDVGRAERGIVYLDEFDKIRRADTGGLRDVSGEGVQNALLTLLDGRRTTFSETHCSGRLTVDVSRILFVCTGAFSMLPEVVRRRVGGFGGFGFGSGRGGGALSDDEAYGLATADDLIACGFIPELVGRFASVAALRSLSADSMRRILDSGEDSILAKQRTFFALHGVELEVPECAVAAMAARSAAMGVGARGLVRVVLGVLRPVSWRLPELREEGVVRVRITEEAVRGEGDPELVRSGSERGDGARAGSLRESAFRGLGGCRAASARGGVSDTRGWSSAQVAARLEEVKAGLGWAETEGSARRWWLAFERDNASRPALVLRLAEELLERKATVTEFFLAYVYSNTDNIQANLHYLDYTRLKKRDERRRRKAGGAARGEDAPAAGSAPEGADSVEGGGPEGDGEDSEGSADGRGGEEGPAGGRGEGRRQARAGRKGWSMFVPPALRPSMSGPRCFSYRLQRSFELW